MHNEMKEILNLFQSDCNRRIEEDFSRTLTENDKVRLFFVNESTVFTDGRNIVVDPSLGEIYSDKQALERAEDFMKLPRSISADPWYALRMITRGQNIHECLHIIYTDFPNPALCDKRSSTKAKRKVLALISNIIEDSFIESAGCSVYDNLELYLVFERVALLYGSTPVEGTVERVFGNETDKGKNPLPITEYLDYMAFFLLYPMVRQPEPSGDISEYVKLTKQLFLDGSACGISEERYKYSQKIFDIIESLIPDSDEDIDDEILEKILSGVKTHNENTSAITNISSHGKNAVILRRLFGEDGKPIFENDPVSQLMRITEEFDCDRDTAMSVLLMPAQTTEISGSEYDCHSIHKSIRIIEKKPKPNIALRQAYKNIYNKYLININSYNNRFSQLLKSKVSVRENKKPFGTGILSTNLADPKKRYWYKDSEDIGVPELAVLLMVDGSGSMRGYKQHSAAESCVILHEVLKKQGIDHSIVEHRAIYGIPQVHHNILISFNGRDEGKYNILSIDADEGTREGLSLYWAERYIKNNTSAQKRLIIVLSDGVPEHGTDDDNADYFPPVSVKDTANAVAKIIKRGTDIIAVALDDEQDGCYEQLSNIYPSVINCTDLKQLTGKLLRIISKHLQ